MGILSGLFGKKGEVIDDPLALRDRLFEAVARDDAGGLFALCRANQAGIHDAYPAWLKPDREWLGSDPRRINWYGRNLLAIADCFARKLNDSSLVERLHGGKTSFLDEWNAEFVACSQRMQEHEFEAALPRLEDLRDKLRGAAGESVKRFEGLTTGRIGECLFQLGRADEALACFEEAQSLCAEIQDREGVRAHLGNQIEALRWLDRGREAVPVAGVLAGVLESEGDYLQAARWRARQRIMAAGEPLLRVVFRAGGRVYEEDEVPQPIEGSLQMILERNRLTLARCSRRMEEGGQHFGRGRYQEALASFRSAREADPYAPEPDYQSASVYMLLSDYPRAIAAYEATERLAPGWYLVRSELWLAHQLAAGRFDANVPQLLLALEDDRSPSAVQHAQTLSDRHPELPQAWLLLGECLSQAGRRAEAIAAYERGLSRADEPELRTRLLTSLGTAKTPIDRAALEQAAALNGHLVAAATARLMLRSPDIV